MSEPVVVVPKRGLSRGFDIGRDGWLYWAEYDPMSRKTQIFGLELGDAEAKPQQIVGVTMFGDPDDLVAGRDGFWLAVDNDSRGVCGSRVMWLGRDAKQAVPVSAPACVFGPKRAAGDAEAIWATSATYSHAKSFFVAKGAPPTGLVPLPGKMDVDFDVVVHAGDGIYLGLEHGEVIRRRPDGGADTLALPTLRMPYGQSLAVAVRGDHVYLATKEGRKELKLLRMPRAGGKKEPIGTFELQSTASHLQAGDSGVVLHLSGNDGADRLLLIDPSGACPTVELPLPNLSRRVLVDRDVVYVMQDQGIVATSFAARTKTP